MDMSFEIPNELQQTFDSLNDSFKRNGEQIDGIEFVLYASSIDDPLTKIQMIFRFENGFCFLKSMNRL